MIDSSATPLNFFASIWYNRALIKASTKREIQERYRGSFLGLLWSFINPLFMLAIFTFVFSVVFQARWGSGSGSKTEFALLLFAGLLMFNMFADCITRAPSLILSNVNYVKKVVFPLEILPVVSLLAALFHAIVGLIVWLIAYILFFGTPHTTILLMPVLIIPFCLFIIGLSWILASLGVFLRDVSQLIGTLTTALMFLSPIFYPVTAFPVQYRLILYLNPLTTVVDEERNLLLWGETPAVLAVGAYWFVTFCFAWLGFIWFQKTRKGFSDVL